ASLEDAHAAAESSRPHRSVTGAADGEDAVLREALPLGEVLGLDRVVMHTETRHAAALPAHPHFAASPVNRVDDIVAKGRVLDLRHPAVADPEQPAARRPEPHATGLIGIERAHGIG